WHRRGAVLDRADSAERFAARRGAARAVAAFTGAMADLRTASRPAFLEGVPRRLRHDARKGTQATRALGHLPSDPACLGDVHDGRPRPGIRSCAADVAAADLFRSLA